MDEQKAIMGCLAVVPSQRPPLPSALRWCSICGTEVWVSAAMVRRVDIGDVSPHCLACFDATVQLAGGAEFFVHPDQVETLRAAGTLSWSEQVVSLANRAVRRRKQR